MVAEMAIMNGTSHPARTTAALRPLAHITPPGARIVVSPLPSSPKDTMINRTHNTLSENVRAQSIELLNRYLAASIDLRAQLKHAHWNVRGAAFIAVHELFDKVAAATDGYADTIAERAAALGGTAHGTVQFASERSFLVPSVVGVAEEKPHIEAISGALASFGEYTRKAIDEVALWGDFGTADLFTEVSRSVDHQLWLVESHSKPESASRANGAA